MLKSLKLSSDDIVELRLERGTIVIQPVRSEEYLLGQLLNGIKPKNIHPEIDFGAASD